MRKMNAEGLWAWPGVEKLKLGVVCAVALAALSSPRAMAGTEMTAATVAPTANCYKDWTLELGAGPSWSNVRSGEPNQAYTIVPINLTASLKLDDVSLDNFLGGFLRGYSEFYFSGQYLAIVHGPEHHYAGIMVGPRYNFVQPGWKLIPYIEGGVGLGFADSDPEHGGFGQDFNFSFDAGAGARYDFTDDFFGRLGVVYQHISNAGMSEPHYANHPVDALGPQLSFGYGF